jgi:hypothetical protein
VFPTRRTNRRPLGFHRFPSRPPRLSGPRFHARWSSAAV